MKRILTLTFEFDDGPWICEETGEEFPTDAVAYAMDQVNGALPWVCGSDVHFVDAKLDGEVLVDGNGFVSDEVKKRDRQQRAFQKVVASHFC